MNNMDNKIKELLDPIFGQYESNDDVRDLYDEITMNLKEASIEHMEQGIAEEVAVNQSFRSIGDIHEVLGEISIKKTSMNKDTMDKEVESNSKEENHREEDKKDEETNQEDKQEYNQDCSDESKDDQQKSKGAGSTYTFHSNSSAKDILDQIQEGLGDMVEGIQAELQDVASEVGNTLEDITINIGEGVKVDIDGVDSNMVSNFFNNYTSFGMMKNLEMVNEIIVPSANLVEIAALYQCDTIYVTSTKDTNVTLREYMTINDPTLYATYQVNDGKLEIIAGKRPVFLGGLRTKIELLIPVSYTKELRLQVTSGSLKMADVKGLASLITKSKSGSHKLQGLKASKIHATANSGSIKLTDCVFDSITAGTNSGSIKLNDVISPNCIAKTTSGSIKAYESELHNKVTWISTSGSLKIEDSKTNELDLVSTSGSVKVITDKVKGTFMCTSGSVTVSTKEMIGDVNIKSTSGSAKLYLQYPAEFSFDLRNGSGSAKVKASNTNYTKKNSHHKVGYVTKPDGYLVTGESTSGSITIVCE